MGLYQWAFSVKNKAVINRFEYNQDYKHDEIFFWGRNHFVHNWMEKLYESIGGKDEFNMKNLQLLPEDIDKLEKDTKSGKIKEYDKLIKEYDKLGFLWEDKSFEYYEYSSIIDFCEKAREEFKKDNAVFYVSCY